MVINIPKEKIKCVSIRSRSVNYCFKPKSKNTTTTYKKQIKGLTTFIGLFFCKNIGHLLFDDLYSLYVSLLKFNYNMSSFNIILSENDSLFRHNIYSAILEKFSMNKIIYESDIKNSTIFIKTLIVGVGHQCQRCINKEYSIAGGKEYNSTWWMRKRMYYVYNITSCKNKHAVIINNKRYTEIERIVLKRLSESFSKLRILFIDWKKYTSFKKQLQILSCTNIYISGPGTGLLNFPFMSDPGIIINLGALYRGCPSFMEQYIEEGSMHFISLYYPSITRRYGIQETEIKLLLVQAINILNNWTIYKNYHRTNLNIEGEIFRNISRKYPHLMDKFIEDTDWAKDGGVGIWAEKLIYYPFCYNLSYIINATINEVNKNIKHLGCKISKSNIPCDKYRWVS